MEEVIRLRGHIEIFLKNAATDQIINKVSVDNVVVTAGRRWALEQLASSEMATNESISYLAVGTGTTAPATSDTGLVSEYTRKAIGTFTTSNLTSNPPSWQAEVSFNTNEANTTLGEIGLFNSSASGTMFARATFSTVNKTTSNTLSVSYTISA